ncbi:MAG: hypothetical protein ACOYYU_15355 [Chloroflexota bacterium]
MRSKRILHAIVLFSLLMGIVESRTAYALGTPQIVSIDPPSPAQVGTCISIRARVDWDSDFRSMRIRFGNEGWQESSEIEFERSFCTSNYSPGWYTIRVEVARQGDNDWSSPTVAEMSYELTAASEPLPPEPPSEPQISCSIDSFDVWPSPATIGQDVRITGTGQCNTGVRAIRIKVDGGVLYEIGAPSLDTIWHTSDTWEGSHQIRIEIAGWGDNDWVHIDSRSRNIEIVNPSQPAPLPSNPFNTGDVIQIGNDVFVIVNGERRLVPNPDTLDALCISRDWIDNQGLSNSELKDIHRGADIPDVNIDLSGLTAFREQYFPNCFPTSPSEPDQQQPSPEQNPSAPPDSDWYVGARVDLCAGAQIRTGSGFSYPTRTIVPENNWQVDIIDGPRNSNGVTWWNISRKNIDGGGTGWVYFEQAGQCGGNSEDIPTQESKVVPTAPSETNPDNYVPEDKQSPNQEQPMGENTTNQTNFNETLDQASNFCDFVNPMDLKNPLLDIGCGGVSIVVAGNEVVQYANSGNPMELVHGGLNFCSGTLGIAAGLIFLELPAAPIALPIALGGAVVCQIADELTPK